MEEIWKDIQGYEGLYQISNMGRVKSLERTIIQSNGYERLCKEKIKSITKKENGYLQVELFKNKTRKHFYIHRLVAQAFLNNVNNLSCINHKDENKVNNCVENLEYCSYEYNNNYGNHIKKCSESRSKKVMAINVINGYILELNSMKQGKLYGFNDGNIWRCCNGEKKIHK